MQKLERHISEKVNIDPMFFPIDQESVFIHRNRRHNQYLVNGLNLVAPENVIRLAHRNQGVRPQS